jgi:hypothetical protein
MAEALYPQATRITDIYHAREHLTVLAKHLAFITRPARLARRLEHRGGRGNIEAIVVKRAKQSGMHWTTEAAADTIALRCQHVSGRWDERPELS